MVGHRMRPWNRLTLCASAVGRSCGARTQLAAIRRKQLLRGARRFRFRARLRCWNVGVRCGVFERKTKPDGRG